MTAQHAHTIGPYTILQKIGSGGMATVYRARHPQGHDVAVKVLAFHLAEHAEVRRRFEREAQTLLQFNHPHILPVFDFGEDNGALYMVMRLMDGRSLHDLLQSGPMHGNQIADMVRQIASALDYAHARGVIHRDVKPKNILFDREGKPYLADFGVAFTTSTESDSRLTATGAFVGTIAYAAPEQLKGEPMGRPTDIYALGIMVYEMATGRLPFEASNPMAVMEMQMYEPPPNPLAYNPRLPIGFYNVLVRALAKLPAQRYPSAMKFSEALDEALGLQPSTETFDAEDAWLYGDIRPIGEGVPLPAPPDSLRDTPPSRTTPPPPPDPDATACAGPGPAARLDEPDTVLEGGVETVVEPERPTVRLEVDTSPAAQPDPTGPPKSQSPGTEPPRRPVIRPIGAPPPPKTDPGPIRPLKPARRALPVRLLIAYGVIVLGLSLVATAATYWLVHRDDDESALALDATATSAALGVSVDYPSGWYALEASVRLLPGDASPAILLSDTPVPQDGPYTAAAMVIAVQRINAEDVFGVPPICQARIIGGPEVTFECMAEHGYLTPTRERFGSARLAGGLKLPGTLPPAAASMPMILFPATPDRWLAVIVVAWDAARWTTTAEGYDLWARVARRVG